MWWYLRNIWRGSRGSSMPLGSLAPIRPPSESFEKRSGYEDVQDDIYLRRLTMHTTAPPEPVVTQDRTSLRLHVRIRFNDTWYVDERCQTDQSGDFDIVGPWTNAIHPTPELMCRFCFKS